MNYPWTSEYPEDYASEIEWGEEQSIYDFVREEQAGFDDSRPAVTCLGSTLSYRELWQEVDIMAAQFGSEWGLVKGDRIALMLPNSIQFVVCYLASLRLGLIVTAVNPLYTDRELAHQLNDSGAKALVVLDFMLGRFATCRTETQVEHIMVASLADYMPVWKRPLFFAIMERQGQVVPYVSFEYDSYRSVVRDRCRAPFGLSPMDLSDTALLQYTGGTTGVSKGAELTHRNVVANIKQVQNCIHTTLEYGSERMLAALPLYHIFAMNAAFLSMLRIRAEIVLLPKPVPLDLTVTAIKKHQPTAFVGINTLFNGLLRHEGFLELNNYPFKCIVAGGMTLQPTVAEKWAQITGTEIREGYGLTEASPVTHMNPFQLDAPEQSIGLPVASTEAKVVDESGTEVRPGEMGELLVRGPQVMKGYWNRPEATQDTIRDGWLYTGDVAVMDEHGWFSIVDRKKDMIIVSGFNVYPTEVEEVISRHLAVSEVAVVGVPSDKTGEMVKAFIVPADLERGVDIDQLKVYCYEQLTRYKVPKEFELRDELPKSTVGKILRRKLREE